MYDWLFEQTHSAKIILISVALPLVKIFMASAAEQSCLYPPASWARPLLKLWGQTAGPKLLIPWSRFKVVLKSTHDFSNLCWPFVPLKNTHKLYQRRSLPSEISIVLLDIAQLASVCRVHTHNVEGQSRLVVWIRSQFRPVQIERAQLQVTSTAGKTWPGRYIVR